jgi:hypothetical protein
MAGTFHITWDLCGKSAGDGNFGASRIESPRYHRQNNGLALSELALFRLFVRISAKAVATAVERAYLHGSTSAPCIHALKSMVQSLRSTCAKSSADLNRISTIGWVLVPRAIYLN